MATGLTRLMDSKAHSAAHAERLNRVHNASLLGGLGLFDQGLLAYHNNDPRICHMKPPPVVFRVKADLGAFGKADVAINDRAANA